MLNKIFKNKIISAIIKIIKYLIFAILIGFIFITLYQRLFPNGNGILGFKTYVIVSDSMSPDLKVGDVILVKEKEASSIEVGDIITYKGMTGDYEGKIITHRVEQIQKENDQLIFYTKGDSNNAIDPAVYEKQLCGIVLYRFFFFSIISKILRNTIGFVLLIVLPLMYIYITEVKDIKKDVEEKLVLKKLEDEYAKEKEEQLRIAELNDKKNTKIMLDLLNKVNNKEIINSTNNNQLVENNVNQDTSSSFEDTSQNMTKNDIIIDNIVEDNKINEVPVIIDDISDEEVIIIKEED